MLKCHKNGKGAVVDPLKHTKPMLDSLFVETWYACEQCSKVFILKHEYDKHQLVHQTVTDKSVICEHCASSFFSQEALKEHIKISHTVVSTALPGYWGVRWFAGVFGFFPRK